MQQEANANQAVMPVPADVSAEEVRRIERPSRPSSPMNEIGFKCCFCGKRIIETGVDPCALVLVGNFSSSHQDEHVEQDFYCHLACFKKAVQPDIPVEIEDILADQRAGQRE
jgi:hypothetical protein